jgi:hypothetical protein
MNSDELERLVHERLDEFYRRRLDKLTGLKLQETLKKKNPYLFRAIGVEKASEIVELILSAYMSSSEETIFGEAFFEPIARAACKGLPSGGTGIDVLIETEDEYTVVSVKSGPHWGNASQMARLRQDFETQRSIFTNRKMKKQFRALLAHCYGRKYGEPGPTRMYSIRSGQAFWEEITGDSDFYLKLIRLMDDYPAAHRAAYDKAWSKAVNRFEKEFLIRFSTEAGSIDWEELVRFNSGKNKYQSRDERNKDGNARADV